VSQSDLTWCIAMCEVMTSSLEIAVVFCYRVDEGGPVSSGKEWWNSKCRSVFW